MPDTQTTEDRATQLLYSIQFKLSHAIFLVTFSQRVTSNTKHAFNSIFGCVFPNLRQETLFLRVLQILQQKTRQILTLRQNSIYVTMLGLQIFVSVQTFWQTPFTRSGNFCYPVQCTLVPLSTKSTWKILTTGASQLTAGSLCSVVKYNSNQQPDFVPN